MPLKKCFFSTNGRLKAHFLSKVKLNTSLWYFNWSAQTKFVSNVPREPKRVAHLCLKPLKSNHIYGTNNRVIKMSLGTVAS